MLIARTTSVVVRCAHVLLICAALICGARPISAQVTPPSDEKGQQQEPVCPATPSPDPTPENCAQPPGPAAGTAPSDASAGKPTAAGEPGLKTPQPDQTLHTPGDDSSVGKQPKRILWIIPNYRAVSANTFLPPLSLKGKLWLGTEDTFDYSNFIFVGVLAGENMATKSEPTFGQGAAGYGRYYWHSFADGALENYMVEAIVPALTKEDPRYYTLGKGGFLKRTGYAVSRLFITRNDAGKNTFNFSEIAGAGAAAAISNAYYPPQNTWVKTYQRWGTQVGLDGLFNILKEFWPDIDHAVFHGHYGSSPP